LCVWLPTYMSCISQELNPEPESVDKHFTQLEIAELDLIEK